MTKLTKTQAKVLNELIENCTRARSMMKEDWLYYNYLKGGYTFPFEEYDQDGCMQKIYHEEKSGLMWCIQVNARTIKSLEKLGYLTIIERYCGEEIVQLNFAKCGI